MLMLYYADAFKFCIISGAIYHFTFL